MDDLRVLAVYGTRPEIIKMAPVVHALRAIGAAPMICSTGQHQELAKQMNEVFGLSPEYELNVMTEQQSLAEIATRVLTGVDRVLAAAKPEFILVQGDTTTTYSAALAAFYRRIPVGHVEAGLRTFDKLNPFPEEVNRILTSHLATRHYAPTELAQANLLREGIDPGAVLVTGNTVVDALHWMRGRLAGAERSVPGLESIQWDAGVVVLVTAHRRENWGKGIADICAAIVEILGQAGNAQVIFPVHPNPIVRDAVRGALGGLSRVHLIDALSYPEFVAIMSRCHIVITDSGGVQEEVASLGKPVVIARETTERPEVVDCGLGVLVGTNPERICAAVLKFLADPPRCRTSPFGDGNAALRIAEDVAGWIRAGKLSEQTVG